MILKIQDARGWVTWREVRQVDRLGWSSEVVDTVPATSEETERARTELSLAGAATTRLPYGHVVPNTTTRPIEATPAVQLSENTRAALRLRDYLGLETTLHQLDPAPLPEVIDEGNGMASAVLCAGENPLLWLRITELDGREHVEGHDLRFAYLMSDEGKTLDSLV